MPNNQNQFFYIALAFAAGFAVGANWPEIRNKIAPLLNTGTQKFGDLYAYLAQMLGDQKENFEDNMAEQKVKKEQGHKSQSPSRAEFMAGIAQMMAGANKENFAADLANMMSGKSETPTAKKKTVKRKAKPKGMNITTEGVSPQTA